jgi:predicted phage terminase large subunit-like protein
MKNRSCDDLRFDELDVIRSVTRDSFYEFVREFWETIITEKPVYNWHIKYICKELQVIAERVFKGLIKSYDLIINVPPGSTKSTIASIMYPAWIWTRMPSAKFIGASYSADLAMDLSRRCRDIVTSDKYKACWPDVLLREDQNAKSFYVNTKKGFRIAVGTGGITGYHGHFIVVDDPINPNEAVSEAYLKAANTWMSETLSTRKVDKSVTPTVLIMQRLHQDDPTANMLTKSSREGGVRHICLPAESTGDVKPVELKKRYINKLLDPIRLSKEVLNENMKQLGEYGYAGQFAQNPVPVGGGMFKTDRIQTDIPPDEGDLRKWKSLIRYWDKAGTAGKGMFTVGIKMGQDIFNHIWLLDVRRGQWDSSKREGVIKQTALFDGRQLPISIEQEPGSGGKESAENTVRNLIGWKVIIDRPVGDKTMRADPLSVQINNGNFFMKPAEWNRDYIDELKFFPYSKYKDQVDASTGAFAYIAKKKIVVGALGRCRRN